MSQAQPPTPPCHAPTSTKCTADVGRTRYGQEGEPGLSQGAHVTPRKREPIGLAEPLDGPATRDEG